VLATVFFVTRVKRYFFAVFKVSTAARWSFVVLFAAASLMVVAMWPSQHVVYSYSSCSPALYHWLCSFESRRFS